MKEYFRKPYMTQGITKHSDYMKAIPQKAIDVQGQIAPNIEFKKPYDYQPNTAQMIHYYANNLHYLGGDPVPPLNDPSLLPHAPVLETPTVEPSASLILYPKINGDDKSADTSFGSLFDTFQWFWPWLRFPIYGLLRIPDVKIIRGTKIKGAMLNLCSKGVSWPEGNTASKVLAASSDNPLMPTSWAEWSALSWDVASANFVFPITDGGTVDIDVKTLVQQSVNRPGFVSGNSILFRFGMASQGTSSQYMFPYAFDDGDAGKYPCLEIDY